MTNSTTTFAFIEDPDGYKIELIERDWNIRNFKMLIINKPITSIFNRGVEFLSWIGLNYLKNKNIFPLRIPYRVLFQRFTKNNSVSITLFLRWGVLFK